MDGIVETGAPGLFARADGAPFKILVRGDCCCRRAVNLNRDLFPRPQLLINEKCPSVCYVDTLAGCTPTLEELNLICDITAMPKGMQQYFTGQIARSILEAVDADLLMMDSYADAHFELWRHRAAGWRIWMHPKYLRDRQEFERTFVKEGRRSLDDAVEDAVKIIDTVRKRNPRVPVLFLNQPFEYYRNLQPRREFYTMGARLAERVPGLFFGGVLRHEELEPADMDSCGPGQTLHFTGATYRRMISRALATGLAEALRHSNPWPGPRSAANRVGVPGHILPVTPAAQTSPRPDAVAIGLGRGSAFCANSCVAFVDGTVDALGQYFRYPELAPETSETRYTPMLIPASAFVDFDAWEAAIKRLSDGERLRNRRKAERLGYVVDRFAWRLHVPDVHAVNTSRARRSGGPMRGGYLRSIEEMGGYPTRQIDPPEPSCRKHWRQVFGVFLPEPGHRQGDVIVNRRLVGYISLKRTGDFVLYSQILGHGDHLANGVMILLHHSVIRWLADAANPLAEGLRYVMYGGAESGGEGLRTWKERAGFTPHQVDAYLGEAPS